jgi:hypothetical protein
MSDELQEVAGYWIVSPAYPLREGKVRCPSNCQVSFGIEVGPPFLSARIEKNQGLHLYTSYNPGSIVTLERP